MKTVSPQRSRRLAAAALLAPPRPRREYSKWSRDEESAFFEALKAADRADLTRMAVAIPTKTREQIKRYYHRLLRKINVMLAPAIQAINTLDADDVRLSLLSWWSMQQKLGPDACAAALHEQLHNPVDGPQPATPSDGAPSSAAFMRGLRSLVITNRKRLHTRRLEQEGLEQAATPGTGAAADPPPAQPAKTAAVSVAPAWAVSPMPPGGGGSPESGAGGNEQMELPHPGHMTLQLLPVDEATSAAVRQAGFNPLLELTFRTRKTLGSVINHVRNRWADVPAALGLGEQADFRLLPETTRSVHALAGWGDESAYLAAGEALCPDAMHSGGEAAVVVVKYGWLAQGVAVPTPDGIAPTTSGHALRSQQQQQHTPSPGPAFAGHTSSAMHVNGGRSGGADGMPPLGSMLALMLNHPEALGAPAPGATITMPLMQQQQQHGGRPGGPVPVTPEYARAGAGSGPLYPHMAPMPMQPLPVAQTMTQVPPARDGAAAPTALHQHQQYVEDEPSLCALAFQWMSQASMPPTGMLAASEQQHQHAGGGGQALPHYLGDSLGPLNLGDDELEFLSDLSRGRAGTGTGMQQQQQHRGGFGAGPVVRSLHAAQGTSRGGGQHSLPVMPVPEHTNDMYAGLGSLLGAEPSWLPAGAAPGAANAQPADAPTTFTGICQQLKGDM